MRNLPKTYEYFTKHLEGIVLEGYNIVGMRYVTVKMLKNLNPVRRMINRKNADVFKLQATVRHKLCYRS